MSEYTGSPTEAHEHAIADATDGKRFGHWIDGEHIAGEGIETIDPAVREPITTVPRGDAADIDRAVETAREALTGDWGELGPRDRGDRLTEWVERLRAHQDELTLLETLDVGKPIRNAGYEVGKAFDYIEYYADLIRNEEDAHLSFVEDGHAYTRTEPYGVAGLIVPWNYPLVLTAWKVGPALAAGNTVVLKPAEISPLTATRIAQLSADIFPDGVVNVVHGYGGEAGAALTSHADVDKLAFTGNTSTGSAVMEAAAEHITPVSLELGGKSPFIIFPDADIDDAADVAATGIFYNTGQSCDAFSRTLVHESIYEEFLDAFTAQAEGYATGDPLQSDTVMGPLASQAQYEKVTDYLDIGREEARLVRGGTGDGWYVEPTIFADVSTDDRLAQEEIFGPVASVIPFASYEEAIAIANDSKYGLVAGIATDDLSLAHRASADLAAGTVWVNQYGGQEPGTPFGGFKQSGIGRECGKETLDAYRQQQTVNIALDDPEL